MGETTTCKGRLLLLDVEQTLSGPRLSKHMEPREEKGPISASQPSAPPPAKALCRPAALPLVSSPAPPASPLPALPTSARDQYKRVLEYLSRYGIR